MLNTNYHHHMIGIGGAGMAPIAMILNGKGIKVSGSDIAESENLSILRKNGIKVNCGPHQASNLPDSKSLIVIASSAVQPDNPELVEARKRAVQVFRRGEFLAKIANSYEISIAVGGSHGKTSTTGMIAHALKKLGFNPGYAIGGKIKGSPKSGEAGEKFFVCESDESDGTNVFMKAKIAVISNIDDDHEWNFSGGKNELFANFAKFALNSEYLIFGDSVEAQNLFKEHKKKSSVGKENFSLLPPELFNLADFQKTNILLAAQAVNIATGIDMDRIIRAIVDFPGVERRMNVKIENEKVLLIEDYAHHPTELSALLSYLQKIKNGRTLHLIFQPHRYARLKKYFQSFAEILSLADKVTVLPVFSAWCPGNEFNSLSLCIELNKRRGEDFAIFADQDFNLVAENIIRNCCEKTIIAVVGAGDCDKLTKILLSKLKKQ